MYVHHSPRDATVCGGDEHRRHVWLERSVEEGKALDVEHVNLVDEQHLQDTPASG